MKKYITLTLLTVMFMISCKENVIGGDFKKIEPNYSTEEVLNKKGASFSYKTKAWSHKTSALKPHWFYHWGNLLTEELPDNVEYVPMFWGKTSVTDENINRLKKQISEGKIKYVLGFNEPDKKDQANMTVDEAIALWPKLESLGVPLGSPAPANAEGTWLKEFMKKASEKGLRLDFIAVHMYFGPNVLTFINRLKETYKTFNKPIWITEMGVADWKASAPSENRYSKEIVIGFMKEILPALDAIDWIHRYCWFDGLKPPLVTSSLFDDDVITDLGKLYASHNPNKNTGPGKDTKFTPPVEDGELIINGGFETSTIAPWRGYKNGVVGASTTSPRSGKYCGRIENSDGSLFYVVDVTQKKTYILKFFSKWQTTVKKTFKGTIKNEKNKAKLFTLKPMPLTNSWKETTYEFTVPDGVKQIRLLFYKGKGFPPFFIDDVSLKEKK